MTSVAIGVTALIAFIFAVRKAYKLFFPISIFPSIHFPSNTYQRGAIGTDIVNKSNETQYIVRCVAKGTYSFKDILLKHIKNPLTHPKLYKTIWYGVMCFPLIDNETIKIEPFEPINKKHLIANHALSFFDTPKFLIEVELSSGRKLHSHRLDVPEFWSYNYSRRASQNANT